ATPIWRTIHSPGKEDHIEVMIISREFVKPFSPLFQHQEPYRLSLLDQLTPTTYAPAIFFYPSRNDDPKSNIIHLKRSLSHALDLYYPLSGRVVDNLFVDRFYEGVPFSEAETNSHMADYLKHHEIESLNQFLPCRPFTKEDMSVPLVACQVTTFSCGGLAVGLSFPHKLINGGTMKAFAATWACISRGDLEGIVPPGLGEALHFFPPKLSLPQNHISLTESLLFREEANYNMITRRLVFDAKAIASLQATAANGKLKAKTSRIVTLSCFIWKCCMSATKAVSSVSGNEQSHLCLMGLLVTISGGLLQWPTPPEGKTELHDLAIALHDTDYMQSLQGEFDTFVFTTWCHSGLTKLDFGWGAPFWVGVTGKVGPAFTNLIVFIETMDGNGIEASITLDEPRMKILERRVVDNLFIDRFYEGVPFFEAQVSVFSCGGIALGLSLSHKLIDAGTAKAFLFTWASISQGDSEGIVPPALSEASQFFPPRPSSPQNHLSLMESIWFTCANFITRRFVFDAKAIASLKAKATNGNPEAKASRIETLSCFIWKCCMSATKAVSSGSLKPSILVEAVNLRRRTKPPMSDASVGNNFWWAIAMTHPTEEKTELHDLVKLLNDAIALYDVDYTDSIRGEEGAETMAESCNQLEELFSLEKPDIFAFTSWCYLGSTKLNFGWGTPSKVGVLGKAGPAFRNHTVFIETMDGKGIEAWITLDEPRMKILEQGMEVHITLRDLVRPASPLIQQRQEPYKLSLLDQLTPSTYSPAILFYTSVNDPNSCIAKLKWSLSHTLDLYYPLSGRVVDNLFIHRFHEGAPFFEARVNCSMSDFLKHQEMESLNLLLPYRPYTKEDLSVSVFSCGGIALGISFLHKLVDAGATKGFGETWTRICRGGDVNGIVPPALSEPSHFFPPTSSFPQKYLSVIENVWFTEANFITRRFVFDAKAIASLKAKVANGNPEVKASRIEILSCFLWKCFTSASKALSPDSPKPSVIAEAVNFRQRTKPPMSDRSIGNNFWWAIAIAHPSDDNTELHNLVNRLNEAIALYDTEYMQSLQGEEGAEAMADHCNQLEEFVSLEKPDIFAFTSWIGLTKINYGWGEPFWVGQAGKVGPAFRNLTVFIETMDGKGIEAWVTLDEPKMKVLERDPEPASDLVQRQEPYKLSLLDQLTPSTYTAMVFFYPSVNNPNSNIIQLKSSLSQALDLYYPLSGRVVDNLFIHRFHEGVPFFEAQVNSRMSDFFKNHEIEPLNQLLPTKPFTKEELSVAPVACQVSVFSCGGITLGLSLSHKQVDGGTLKAFLATWSSISRGDVKGVVYPALSEASHFFPPRSSFPQNHLSLMENLWFTEANYITRRFVFDAKSIASLKAKAANGNPEAKTSRIVTLSCFIWKCCMSAAKALSSASPKPSILVEAVNLRHRTKPPMSDASIGDNFWWAIAMAHPTDEKRELHDLVNLLNDAISLYDGDYTQSLQGEEGAETMEECCNQLEDLFSLEQPDIFAFTSWCDIGLTKLNFGWGIPFWVGAFGKVGPAFRNLTVFIETTDGKRIEAWITLDEPRMKILERDPDFLAFCLIRI
ncbi:hypothetical protein Tsubulata_029391, partial [Turnera subulata]